jgi:phosphate transport system substrate-binding protein
MKMTARLSLLALAATSVAGIAAAQSINAAGATFPEPIYTKWFSEYKKVKGAEINYQANGSGAGINAILKGLVDFGASDRPMNDKEIADAKVKLLYFPTVIGGIVPAYNLPGVSKQLKFTGEVLADIFQGKIEKWNDKAIAALNPGVKLPDMDIASAHRSDSSGTTFVFTEYLSKVSKDWKLGVDQAPKWPGGSGQPKNDGVAGYVKNTPGAIGYVEVTYVLLNKGMQYGLVKNAAGEFMDATVQTLTAAANGVTTFPVSLTNTNGKGAYPIATMTYLLIPSKIDEAKKKDAIKGFLTWMQTEGQKTASTLGYAPLPKGVVGVEQKQLAEIK